MAKTEIAVIAAEFNKEFTDKMLLHALKAAKKEGLSVAVVLRPAGVYDSIYLLDKALKKKGIQGAVLLACVIKGKTRHDKIIVESVARKALDLTVLHGKPVGFGVIGYNATEKIAKARLKDYAERAVMSVKKSLTEAEKI